MIDRFNIHDRSVMAFMFAETGFVSYKVSRENIPYIVQYLVNINPLKNPPGLLHIPLTRSALSLGNYCLPDYIETAWEWVEGSAEPRPSSWRPDEDYIYNCLNTPLFLPDHSVPGDRLTFPITYEDHFWR